MTRFWQRGPPPETPSWSCPCTSSSPSRSSSFPTCPPPLRLPRLSPPARCCYPGEDMRAAGHQVAAALLLFAAVFGTRAEVIDDILGSLTDAVSFLEREREQVNLDGLVGFTMLQGWSTVSGEGWRRFCCRSVNNIGISGGLRVVGSGWMCVIDIRYC